MIEYGLDLYAPKMPPSANPDDDWAPMMKNSVRRLTWPSDLQAVQAMDTMKRSNANLTMRVVEVYDQP